MINPITIIQDVQLVTTALTKIQYALPAITKIGADLAQAKADNKNPAALQADLAAILTDVTNDLNLIASLFPSTKPTPPPVLPAA